MTGPNALKRTTGRDITDIEVVLPTHSHADHVGGLECMALKNRYVGIPFKSSPKLKMVINEEYQRVLWDYTLRGGLEWNEDGPDKGQRLQFCDFFDIIRPVWKTQQPREVWAVDVGGIHLEIFRTKHIPDNSSGLQDSFLSFGMTVDDRVFISGDTRFDQELVDLYSSAEWMFHDVQFFPGSVHAHIEDLKTLTESVRKKMLLYHYSDDWESIDISNFAGWTKPGIGYAFE